MQLFLLRIQAVLPERMSFFIALDLAEVANLKSVFLQSEHVCMHASTMQVR